MKTRLANFGPEICAIFRLHDAAVAFRSMLWAMPRDDTAVSFLANCAMAVLKDDGILDVRNLGLS